MKIAFLFTTAETKMAISEVLNDFTTLLFFNYYKHLPTFKMFNNCLSLMTCHVP